MWLLQVEAANLLAEHLILVLMMRNMFFFKEEGKKSLTTSSCAFARDLRSNLQLLRAQDLARVIVLFYLSRFYHLDVLISIKDEINEDHFPELSVLETFE